MVFDSPADTPSAQRTPCGFATRAVRCRCAVAVTLCAMTATACHADVDSAVRRADDPRRAAPWKIIDRTCATALELLPQAKEQLDRARRLALGGDPDGARALLDAIARAHAMHMEINTQVALQACRAAIGPRDRGEVPGESLSSEDRARSASAVTDLSTHTWTRRLASLDRRRLLVVSMKRGWLSSWGWAWSGSSGLVWWWERRSSLYGLLGGRTRCHGRPAAWAQVQKGRQAARRKVEPPAAFGVKGSLRVSMCQIASVSFLAMSICATFAPRCLPRRRLVRW